MAFTVHIQIKASKLPYLHQWEQKHSCLPVTWQPLDHWSWEGHRVWPSLLVVQSAQLWPDPDLMQPLSPSWPYPAVKHVLNLKKTETKELKVKQKSKQTKTKNRQQQTWIRVPEIRGDGLRGRPYLTPQCHLQNDFCIKVDSNET